MATVRAERARRLFTVEEYERMVEAGILAGNDRVELVEGEVLEMSPIGDDHAATMDNLTRLLAPLVGPRAVVRIQGPLTLSPRSKVQPDLVVLRPRSYRGSGATAADALLVIEVADTSLRRDRTIKMPLYARAGVPELWIVDQEAGNVEVHRDPGPAGYAQRGAVGRDGTVSPLAFPDLVIAVTDIVA